MKKFVSGMVVGLLLFAGTSVFADSVGLIGQKVQGIFSIEKNGKKIADAIIINGSAFAPVRSVADATGANLVVEGKKIIMSDISSGNITDNTPPASTSAVNTGSKTLAQLQAERDKVAADISRITAGVKDLEESVIPSYEIMAKELANNGELGKRAQASAEEYKKLVEERKVELADLQKQLVELDAQIAALNN